MTISFGWFPSTPGTPEQLTAAALWKVTARAALAGVDDSEFSLFNEAPIYAAAPDGGLYRWHAGTSLTADGRRIITGTAGQWVLEMPVELWVTQLEKLALTNPYAGLRVYNKSTNQLEIYIGGRWQVMATARADYDISGTVTNTRTGSALPGVTVTANGNQTATTDALGAYAIANVPKGAAVSIAGALSGYNDYSSTADISAGNATKNFTMARRTVSGAVIDSGTSSPISGATVQIASLSRSTTTDGSGNYSLIDIPDGSYTLAASASGYTGGSTGITVTADLTQNFALAVLTATVTGTIVSSTTSQPVNGASVTISSLPAVTSNGSGVYSRSGVPQTAGRPITATKALFSNYSSTISPNADPYTANFQMVPISSDVMPLNATALDGVHTASWSASGLTTNRSWGNEITVSRPIRVTHYRARNCSGGSLTVSFRIYNSSGTLVSGSSLNSQSVPTNFPAGWADFDYALSSPITLTAGTYRIVAYCSGNPLGLENNVNGTSTPFSNHPAVSFGPGWDGAGDVYPNTHTYGSRIYAVSIVAEL